MANGGNIRYSIGFNVDKTGLNQIKASLQEIQKLTAQDLIKINNSSLEAAQKDLEKIKASAQSLEGALEKSFNTNIGALNVSKFNQELKKLNLNQIYTDFTKAGIAGQNAFRDITTQILTTNMHLKKSHSLLEDMATTMANTVKWGIASSVMNNFSGSVQQAYGYVKSLDNSLNDIRIVTGASADEMDRFAEKANKAAKELGKTTTEYTDAALIYYQQGLSSAEVEARTETTLKASNVTGQAAEQVSEQLTAVWNGYKVNAEEAELYVDKLAAVAATTAADLEELSIGMSKVASAANIMGVDVDQLNAQLATIVSVTRQAPESVGTALKTIYARMGDIEAGLDGEVTLDEYTSKMAEMGVKVLDANGNLRDMGTVIEEIGGKWESMSREQQIALSQTMAGTRQYNNLLSLFDNWDMYTSAMETSKKAAGTLQKQQETYMESIQAHLQQLKASSEDLYDSLLDSKSINPIIDGLTLITNLSSNFVDAIGGGGGVLLGLGSIATKVFSQQIANGISTFIENMQSAKENANQLRAELEILNTYNAADLGNQQVETLIKMKESILNLDKAITNEERNIANEYINQQNQLYEQQNALEAKKMAAEEAYKRATGVDVSFTSGGYDKKVVNQDLIDRAIEIESLSGTQEEVLEGYKKLKQAAQEYIDIANSGSKGELKTSIEKLENATSEYNSTLMKQLKLAEEVNESESYGVESKQKLSKALADLDKMRDKDGALNLKNINIIKQLEKVEKARIEVFKNEGKALRSTAKEIEGFSRAEQEGAEKAEQLKTSWSSFLQTIELRQKIQQGVQLAASFGQLASSINTIKNIGSIWSNDDLSGGEKLLQTVSNLGFALPMLANSIGQVNKALGIGTSFTTALSAAKEKYLAITKIKIAQDKLSNAVTAQGISSETALQLALVRTQLTETQMIPIRRILLAVKKGEMLAEEADIKIKEMLAAANIKVAGSYGAASSAAKTFILSLGPAAWLFGIVAGISALAGVIDLVTTSTQEASEAFNEAISNYDNAEKELEDLKSQVKQINSQLDELYSRDELTLSDEEEIARLEKLNKELERQIKLQERQLELEAIKALKTGKEAVNKGVFSKGLQEIDYQEANGEISKSDADAARAEFFLDNNEAANAAYEQFIKDPQANAKYIEEMQAYFKAQAEFTGDLNNIIVTSFEEIFKNLSLDEIKNYKSQLENNKELGLDKDGWTEEDLKASGLGTDLINQIKEASLETGISINDLINGFIELEHASRNSLEYTIDRIGELSTPELANILTPVIEGLQADGVEFSTIIESFENLDFSEIDWSNPQTFIEQLAGLLKETSLQAQETKNSLNELADTKDIADRFDFELEPFEDLIDYIQESSDEIEGLSDDLKKNGDYVQKVAKELSRYDRALEKTIDNYDDWAKMLKGSNIQDNAKAVGELKEVYGDLLDLEVSDSFAADVENLELLKQAANGSTEAYDELLDRAQQDIITKYRIDKSEWDAQFAELMAEHYQGQNLEDLEVGASLNNTAFLQGLTDMVNQAGLSVEDATSLLSSMGIDAEVVEDTENTTETSKVAHLIPKPVEMKGQGLNPVTGIPTPLSFTGVQYDIKYETIKTPKQNKAFGLRVTSANKSSGGNFKYTNTSHGGGSQGGSSGGGGGGGGGGSSSAPKTQKPIESKKDRYHDVNVQLEQINEELEDIGKEQDKLFGQDLINSLNRELELLQEQRDVLKEKMEIAREEQKELQETLALEGIAFNEDGSIENYLAIVEAKEAYINSLIEQYNSMSAEEQESFKEDVLDPALEAYEEFIENIDDYEELLLETIPDIEDDLQDIADREIEINIKKLGMEVELRLELTDAQKDWDEFKRKVIDGIDEDDIYGNAAADMDLYETIMGNGAIEASTNTINSILGEIATMNAGGTSSIFGDDKQAALDALTENMDNLMDHMGDLVDLQDQIHEAYLDMIDKTSEAFDQQIESYEYVGEILDHNLSLIQLINGEDAYAEMANVYEAKHQNNLETLAAQRDAVDYYQQMMETETDEEALEKWTELWKDAVSDLNNTVEESVQTIIDRYSNSINIIFDELDNKLTNGKGLDYITQEWELKNEEAERYLDTINASYEVQSLERKIQQSIDNSDSIATQKKLNDFMDEEIKKLREKDKLTQYDIDRANALYEIKLKEIALEEAQQNKAQMRLRRDSSGNYSYQFVADQDSISQAQQELDDAKNSLYNMDRDKYKENQQAILDTYSEYLEKMRDAANLSAEERELIETHYQNKLNELLGENNEVRLNLMESGFDAQAALYGSDVATFQEMSEEERRIFEQQIIPNWNSGLEEMIATMNQEFQPAVEASMAALQLATDQYNKSIEEIEITSGQSFGQLASDQGENVRLAGELATKLGEVLEQTKNETEATKNLKTEVDLLAASYKTTWDNALGALSAAQALKEWELQQAADAAKKEEEDRKNEEDNNNSNNDSGGGGEGGGTGGTSSGGTPENLIEGVAASIWMNGGVASGWYAGKTRYERMHEKGVYAAQEYINKHGENGDIYKKWSGKRGELKKYYYGAFDTGGYTGEWGDEGKLAILHEKELVLNKEDTKNILAAISMTRGMNSVLSALNDSILTRTSSLLSGLNSNFNMSGNEAQEMQQNVNIEANFPNVSSRAEIEDAFKNLVNIASQHAFNTQR